MRAGRLRHRITIQQYVTGSPQQKATGEPDGAWSTYATVWASVEPVSGREPFLAQAHLAEVTTKIGLRYRSGITSAMRVSFDSRIFDIKAILNWEERNIELQLLCTEGVNQG